jgi:hypothetical protein
MKMIDLNDVKTALASGAGLGNWMLEIDTILHVLISVASLVYIILKIRELIKKGKENGS